MSSASLGIKKILLSMGKIDLHGYNTFEMDYRNLREAL
jgi:sulfate adenylyltransferase subunit 1 (EFTu-like GTPase family)